MDELLNHLREHCSVYYEQWASGLISDQEFRDAITYATEGHMIIVQGKVFE